MLATMMMAFCLSLPADIPASINENPFQVSDEIRQFLEKTIDRSSDPMQQLQTLVRVVFQGNALSFTYQPETRTAIDTFAKRGGNCVSFTFLFLAMARSLGLDARYREVDIVPTWSRVGNIISMIGHANVAVWIGGQAYSVDLFPQVNRLEVGGRVVSDGRAIAHFYNNRGVEQLALGNQQPAIGYFQKALDSDPTTAFVWANLGVAQLQIGSFEDAEKSYQKALQLDAGDLVAMSNLAALYERLGRQGDAKHFQGKVRKFNRKNPYFHFNLGLQAYQAGGYKESIEHYRIALKLKPKEHHIDMAMARAYAQLGDMIKAAEYLRLAAKYAPDAVWKNRYSEKLELLAAHRPQSPKS